MPGSRPDDLLSLSDEDDDAEPAKAVCAACPVREACLEHALGFREKEGVWGGATERERRRIIRQRRRIGLTAAGAPKLARPAIPPVDGAGRAVLGQRRP